MYLDTLKRVVKFSPYADRSFQSVSEQHLIFYGCRFQKLFQLSALLLVVLSLPLLSVLPIIAIESYFNQEWSITRVSISCRNNHFI